VVAQPVQVRAVRIQHPGAGGVDAERDLLPVGRPHGKSAVAARAKELVQFARRHGYRVDELIRIIEDVA
jgi:hypothetical protein